MIVEFIFQMEISILFFSVDSNSLNFYELPKKITLLASSFAGGATVIHYALKNFQMKKDYFTKKFKFIKIATKK